MRPVFMAVDCQNDFMNPEGKLYINDAEKIKENLSILTKLAKDLSIRVVTTADWHNPKCEEFSSNPDGIKTFPPHCIAASKGAGFIPEVEPLDISDRKKVPYIVSWSSKTFDKIRIKKSRNIVIQKDTFDVWAGNPLTGSVFKILVPSMVIVYGVAADVCVKFAIAGLLKENYTVAVVKDAIKEINHRKLPKLLESWSKAGVQLYSTLEIAQMLTK